MRAKDEHLRNSSVVERARMLIERAHRQAAPAAQSFLMRESMEPQAAGGAARPAPQARRAPRRRHGFASPRAMRARATLASRGVRRSVSGWIEPLSSFSLEARAKSFGFAFEGLETLVLTQHNAWIHAVATVLVTALGLAVSLTAQDWLWIVLAIAMVWIAEAFNTAIEALADVVSPEFHPGVKKAKDVAAAAVLIAAMGAAGIGALVFWPYVFA